MVVVYGILSSIDVCKGFAFATWSKVFQRSLVGISVITRWNGVYKEFKLYQPHGLQGVSVWVITQHQKQTNYELNLNGRC